MMTLEVITLQVVIRTHFSLMWRLVWWDSSLPWHSVKGLKKRARHQLTRRMNL
jgi:hypothetical protein